MEFSNNCYLIKHDKGLLLWDTGVPDAVAGMPDGMVVANGAITYRRAKTLASQLAQLGVKPDEIMYVALSHTHGDHVGNIAMFPASTLLIQGAEYDWSLNGPVKPAYPASQTVKKLAGDHDVFGDAGSHARPRVAAGAAAEDRIRGAVGRRRPLPGQLDAAARAADELQP
jgi:glyoxylase-like metal-dependent hydrolase (beta-lactamase superfamily II)